MNHRYDLSLSEPKNAWTTCISYHGLRHNFRGRWQSFGWTVVPEKPSYLLIFSSSTVMSPTPSITKKDDLNAGDEFENSSTDQDEIQLVGNALADHWRAFPTRWWGQEKIAGNVFCGRTGKIWLRVSIFCTKEIAVFRYFLEEVRFMGWDHTAKTLISSYCVGKAPSVALIFAPIRGVYLWSWCPFFF